MIRWSTMRWPLAAAFLITAPLAAEAAKQDFTLVNHTGYQIDSVYVSQSSSNDWGKDVMGRDTLDDGESVDISFEHGGRTCHWDIRVEYHDGDKAEWSNVNLCDISRVTLHWNRQNQETRATVE
ncbi:MAG: hypothetical protein JO264_19110 [Acidisphaera sp.]|nr:hypothetical protein [Acidisphaera sp.]